MENCMRFYVMYSKDNKDVEFVNAENRLRMQSLTLKGYKNIGTGEHEDVKELNRGVCSNMRGMYEFQVRQNMLLKKELERALMLLKEVHRISDLTPGIQPLSHSVTAPLTQGSRENVRCQHEKFLGEQYLDNDGAVKKYMDSLRRKIKYEIEPHRQVISSAEIMKEIKSEKSKPSAKLSLGRPFMRDFWEEVN